VTPLLLDLINVIERVEGVVLEGRGGDGDSHDCSSDEEASSREKEEW